MKNKGFSLVEIIVALSISTIIIFVITSFAKDIIGLNASAQASMNAAFESRKILSTMVAELRSATPSALGSYTIESAATSSVVFFTDVNSDDVSDRIRYFIDPVARTLKRGVILATGEPPAYTSAETFSTLVTSVANATSTALFDYYDGLYAGTTSPLAIPVNIASIRLIKITVKIEKDPNRSPEPITMTSKASLRNLKDNL